MELMRLRIGDLCDHRGFLGCCLNGRNGSEDGGYALLTLSMEMHRGSHQNWSVGTPSKA